MKKRLITFFIGIVIGVASFAQTIEIKTYKEVDKENVLSYDFVIDIKNKKVTETIGHLFKINIPLKDYCSKPDWFSFSMNDKEKAPRNENELDTCDGYISFNTTYGGVMKVSGKKEFIVPTDLLEEEKLSYVFEKKLKQIYQYLGSKNVVSSELPLLINGYQTFNKTVDANANEVAFPVRTKTGKMVSDTSLGDYEVWTESSWVEVTYKTDAAFLLNWTANRTRQTRTADIYVKAGGVYSKMVLTQQAY